jgi:hypothetical protein
MSDLEQRLTRLETALTGDEAVLAWAEVHEAQRRQAARVRRRLGQRLGQRLGLEPSDPWIVEATARLVGDDPARRAADEALIARWDRAQGITEAAGAARQRIVQRLAMMAAAWDTYRTLEERGEAHARRSV